MDVHSVLFDAFAGDKPLSFFAGANFVLEFEHVLEPEAIFPPAPDGVFGGGGEGGARSHGVFALDGEDAKAVAVGSACTSTSKNKDIGSVANKEAMAVRT